MSPRLEKYREKRDFRHTPEPAGSRNGPAQPRSGKKRAKNGFQFCVQKHAASHLHYDFRLELDGVLLSWAVPKGPSLDPSSKRLAMQTEDHPLDYADFEGVIPKGQYGGGTVLLWDRGTWIPDGDPHQALEKGKIKFTLEGEKLRGKWNLVRTRGDRGKAWLLFKSRDQAARSDDGRLLDERPESVLSGRTLDEIGAHPKRTWHSNQSSKSHESPKKQGNGSKSSTLHIDGVRITHPDRILFQEQGLTKRDLVDYYVNVAESVLPHVVNRPLALVRCPEGQNKECFFQKNIKPSMPEHIDSVDIQQGDGARHVMIRDIYGLISLVQLGVLEIHVWGARADRVDRPDRLVFDLDPAPEVAWTSVIDAAREVRQRLHDLGLESFVKTTGGKGLHLVVPVERRHGWDETKAFTKAFVDALVAEYPERYVGTASKAKRRGKIFIDYLRNGKGATSVAPYSTRAKPSAPVSAPIAWNELRAGTRSDAYTVQNLSRRLTSLKRDPWQGFFDVRQGLTVSMLRTFGVGR